MAGCATTDEAASPDEVSADDVASGDVASGDVPPGDVLTSEGAVAQGESTAGATTTQSSGSGPLIERAGNSSATVMPASSQGAGLAIQGGSEQGSYLLASYSTTTGGGDATARFTVTPRGDAAFVYTLRGTGGGYASRQLKLERAPGSRSLAATAIGGVVTCGDVASGAPTAVTVVFHAATKTFDVRIGGAPTACTNLATKMSAPVVGFRLMDASNAGYGGNVEFTGLAVQ